jgi:hypothetical protein
MDFVINKKDFDSAARQILLGRNPTSTELVELTAGPSTLILAAMGTITEIPIKCETTGSVSITISNLAWLKKISATYKAGPVRLQISGGRIRFQNSSISISVSEKNIASVSEKNIARPVIDIPSDASPMDLLSLQLIFSTDEIESSGLHAKVREAQETMAQRLDWAASSLGEYGFTRSELAAMAEVKLNAHAETTRNVLFPDEDS